MLITKKNKHQLIKIISIFNTTFVKDEYGIFIIKKFLIK